MTAAAALSGIVIYRRPVIKFGGLLYRIEGIES
jgi:hypothetical protein